MSQCRPLCVKFMRRNNLFNNSNPPTSGVQMNFVGCVNIIGSCGLTCTSKQRRCIVYEYNISSISEKAKMFEKISESFLAELVIVDHGVTTMMNVSSLQTNEYRLDENILLMLTNIFIAKKPIHSQYLMQYGMTFYFVNASPLQEHQYRKLGDLQISTSGKSSSVVSSPAKCVAVGCEVDCRVSETGWKMFLKRQKYYLQPDETKEANDGVMGIKLINGRLSLEVLFKDYKNKTIVYHQREVQVTESEKKVEEMIPYNVTQDHGRNVRRIVVKEKKEEASFNLKKYFPNPFNWFEKILKNFNDWWWDLLVLVVMLISAISILIFCIPIIAKILIEKCLKKCCNKLF